MRSLVGIDIGGTKMRCCVRTGQNVRYVELETGIKANGRMLADAVETFLRDLSDEPEAIGIAVPGLVEHGKVIVCDVLPNISGWVPAESISSECAITVLNDADAALVEVAAGLEPRATAAVVMVGTGIGAALLLHGKKFGGASGWAGEFGSIPISLSDEVSSLDAIAGGAALLRALGGDPERAHARLAAGEQAALQSVTRAATGLGLGLATLINILNPDRIILAGGTLRYRGYADTAVLTARRFALAPLAKECTIETPPDGETLVARGAARIHL